jgi:hypothetical protein
VTKIIFRLAYSWSRGSWCQWNAYFDRETLLICRRRRVGSRNISDDDVDAYYLSSIRPSSTIPICLDLGTNNQQFLDDPLYLGLRQRRVSGPEMTTFMDELMHEMSVAFPKLLVQFEVNSKISICIPYESIDLPCNRTSPQTTPSSTSRGIVTSTLSSTMTFRALALSYSVVS